MPDREETDHDKQTPPPVRGRGQSECYITPRQEEGSQFHVEVYQADPAHLARTKEKRFMPPAQAKLPLGLGTHSEEQQMARFWLQTVSASAFDAVCLFILRVDVGATTGSREKILAGGCRGSDAVIVAHWHSGASSISTSGRTWTATLRQDWCKGKNAKEAMQHNVSRACPRAVLLSESGYRVEKVASEAPPSDSVDAVDARRTNNGASVSLLLVDQVNRLRTRQGTPWLSHPLVV
ncbi:hypothetical protein EJ05DRAFT_484410 [Pseudovirgaria hyperparasitica]|uniref:Uncharacterized protein n=1 Tax=Pseudovirgaria hyperparasitica TaxID=470096 RepID=A0A6A6WD12_9PEZI|nr:uncharacterized protein EJ05DRAFT_484410 [Pseudovirgaria hyperparasitica]KAF2759457.1 hypothetical protein EJ05DRAFT_484410 [Pseudovirgaria hyperparasitica]